MAGLDAGPRGGAIAHGGEEIGRSHLSALQHHFKAVIERIVRPFGAVDDRALAAPDWSSVSAASTAREISASRPSSVSARGRFSRSVRLMAPFGFVEGTRHLKLWIAPQFGFRSDVRALESWLVGEMGAIGAPSDERGALPLASATFSGP